MVDRPTVFVPEPRGGWGPPWPNVAEIPEVIAHTQWTLVGGLMTQLHGINAGIEGTRATSDVDLVLHVETTPGVAASVSRQLEALGYDWLDEGNGTARRFKRVSE